jgi:hypothetical protein
LQEHFRVSIPDLKELPKDHVAILCMAHAAKYMFRGVLILVHVFRTSNIICFGLWLLFENEDKLWLASISVH